jgi:peptidoglycan/LPS O-acetylase OafA/YrhL
MAGLDGLRAIAVIAVVIFHLRAAAAKGGFLGVDLFFVISGFLITFLIITEILKTGGLALGAFYLRRARRLLPTVVALLLAITIASLTFFRDELAYLKGGVLSSLGYVTNWWLITDHQSYFQAAGRPSFFQHLWSLAVEEQFYIVWSLVIVAVAGRRWINLRIARRRALTVAVIAFVLALASTALMTVLAVRENLPFEADTSRVYFGSDTHSMGLFLGSAAGAYLAVRRSTRPALPGPRRIVGCDVAGVLALVVLIYWFLNLDEFSPRLYRGGFLEFDAVALVLILAAVQRGSRLGQALDMPVLQWIGRRSYSIYVWHWPVVVVTRPGLDVVGPSWVIQLLRVLIILGLSELTYHFIEVPLRTGQWEAWTQARRQARRQARSGGKPGAAQRVPTYALRGTLVVAGSLILLSRPVHDAFSPPQAAVPAAPAVVPIAPPGSSATPSPTPSPAATSDGTHRTGPKATATSPRPAAGTQPPRSPRTGAPPPAAVTTPAQSQLAVSAFGDSVLLGASNALRARVSVATIDSVEGRQAYTTLQDVVYAANRGTLYPYVVIHTGNNGIISGDQLRATLTKLASRKRVVLINDRVYRDWEGANNDTIRSVGSQFRNVTVLDWYAIASGHPGWFYRDGLHLTPVGAANYSDLVVRALTQPGR